MTIAVTTPTGNVGSRTVRLLAQAGARPRVLLRDPTRLDPGLHDLVDIAHGDLRDPAFVHTATEGVDTLLWITPEDFSAADPLADMATLVDAGTAAVRAHRIPRIVLISSVGAELGTGAGLIDGLAHSEHAFTATGAHVHTLRCGYYYTNLLAMTGELRTGRLTTTADPDRPMPWVDPRDIGDIAAARLLSPHRTGTAVQAVHGPADLTWTQAADILSAALDTTITVHQVTDETMAARLTQTGMSTKAVAAILAMTSGLRDGFTPEQPRTPLTTTPTTLHAWAVTTLAPALTA
ncbi:NAD(P)H-binding protein [Actinoplanes oblitus]|uniref:NAD(P)H-binding protein n=1 Tax=Actinoplanes oblitus TaxID=3040509 RepID=A0ABY8WAE2_9ACTN|nr:NAD(P)H-binding protein [Actinoplanes oblitus]WIM92685.1 NAD(P)H-binding protein [Actinoplanes oblitus]